MCVISVLLLLEAPKLTVYCVSYDHEGRDGMAVNITMQPGDMVLYEGASLIHGVNTNVVGLVCTNRVVCSKH